MIPSDEDLGLIKGAHMSTEPAYTAQDLQRTHELIVEAMKKLGSVAGAGYWPVAKVVAAEFSRIRSEARAGMREACAIVADLQANRWHEGTAGSEASTLIAHKIRSTPDFAADEAIERIKREAHESGIREGASNEALLQRMFNEDGPVKIELERIKREARLEGQIIEAMQQPHEDTYEGSCGVHMPRFCSACRRIAALEGKESSHENYRSK